IDTIVNRGYARRKGSQLIPTFTAFATNNLLEQQFEQLVDIGFTAEMEQVLDDIAAGGTDAVPYLQSFYQGDEGLKQRIDEGLDKIDAKEISSISFPKWEPFVVRVGKYGPYVELPQNGDSTRASLPPDIAPGDIEKNDLQGFIDEKEKGDTVLGIHPEHDQPVLLKSGPYGHYIQLGDDEQEGKPKRVSLPKGLQPDDVGFEKGLSLINLPRELGNHPDTGQVIKAHIGRYGPYVQHGSTFASLTKDDDVLEVELDRALELIAKKEAKNKPQRVLGEHPEDGNMIEIFEGRYGPYVKHNRTNASLPKNRAIDSLTMDEALELLAEKAKKKKGGGKKKTAKKKKG
ncbi:MAG: DNA topoisomerase I, partial [Rhodothermales bacterium]|nr:DNA topoisomerase I [Rhodothermales bacterium]